MQKTAYEIRISDWSSDVCASDLGAGVQPQHLQGLAIRAGKHLSVARNRLLHRRTGESRAQYIRRIGKARPCRFRIAIGGEDSRFPFPPGKGALRGLDLVGRHALEIIIARVEGADMIEAEPAPAIGRWPRAIKIGRAHV